MGIKVLIADDHNLYRAALRQVLEYMPGIEIMDDAANGESAVELSARLQPDVVVLDYFMGDIDASRAAEEIRRQTPGTKIVVLTAASSDEELATRCLRNGASACLGKTESFEKLISVIRDAAKP